MVRVLLAVLLAGCSSPEPPAKRTKEPPAEPRREPPAEPTKAPVAVTVSKENIGRQVRLRGMAINRKGGAVLEVGDQHVWIEGVASWPEGFYEGGDRGKTLEVTGVLDEDHGLPVFVPEEGEPIQQGIPVPEGTDLDAASHRFILRDAKW